jgi:type II secretory pathway component PulM
MNRLVVTRWWQGLAERERTLVVGGGIVVLLVLVYVLLWEPAALGIRKLTADLPQLREQNAALHAMADEAVRLRAAAGSAPPITIAERPAAVRRTLERAGLWSAAGSTAPSDVAATTNVRTLTVAGPVTTVVAAAATARAAPPEVTVDGDRVRVRFDDVDYGVWAGWLASAEGELAARATRVSIVSNAPKSPVGHVRAEALLDWTPVGASSSARP